MEHFKENFASATEQIEPIQATLTGSLPDWLQGSYLRVGPGKFDFDDFSLNHWLDGYAIMSKVSFQNGQVWFRKRYLQSDAYRKACHAQRPIFTEFGTKSYPDPSKNIFSRMLSNFDPSCVTDNASSNIMLLENEVYVSSETCFLRRINPTTLETKEKVDMNKLVGANFASSHPLTDETGATYNLGASFTGGPKYHIIRIPKSGSSRKGSDPWNNAKIHSTVSSSWKASYSYYHSFGMTKDYIVFLEQPLLVNTLKLATSQVKGRSLKECLEWHPQEKVKFIIIKKSTGEVVKTKYISDESFLVLHHVNTYESKGQLVVDLMAYPDDSIIEKLNLEKVRNNEFDTGCLPQLKRFVLPLVDDEFQELPVGEELVKLPACSSSAVKVCDNQKGDHILVTASDISESGWEMPTINPNIRGQPYRFVYGSSGFEVGPSANTVYKVDVETGETLKWEGTETEFPSEAKFIPRPYSYDEDDGIVMFTIADSRRDVEDSVVILDARNFTELARAHVSCGIPPGLHGLFLTERY